MSLLKPLWYQRTLPLSLFSPFVFASRANPRSIYSMFWFVKGVSGDFHGQRRHLKASMEERWDLGRLKQGKSAFRAEGSRRVRFYFWCPALRSRRWRVTQWGTSSTMDLLSWVAVRQTKGWWKMVLVLGFRGRRVAGVNLNGGVYWRGDLCNGYAVVLHFPASAMVSRSGPTAESHAIGN